MNASSNWTTSGSTQTRKQRSSFSQTKFFKACDYVRANDAKLQVMLTADVISDVEKATGIALSLNQLARVKSAIGANWPKVMPPSWRPGRKMLEQTSPSVSANQTAVLANAISDLYKTFGIRVPQELAALCSIES